MKERIKELYELEKRYKKMKEEIKKREARLWIYTDWREVFPDEKRPTVKQKEMYIKEKLTEPLRDKVKGVICPSIFDLIEVEADYHYMLRLYELERELMGKDMAKNVLEEIEEKTGEVV